MSNPNIITVNLSTLTILKVLAILLAIGFLFLISDVLGVIFVALVLASTLEPIINWLQTKGLHRIAATVLIYILIFSLLFVIVFSLLPPLTKQASDMANHFPYYYDKVIDGLVNFTGNQLTTEKAQQLLPTTNEETI